MRNAYSVMRHTVYAARLTPYADALLIGGLYLSWLCAAYLINLFATGARMPQDVFDAWVRFDGIYFRAIAEYGYADASYRIRPEIGFPFLTAFFPLFSLLIHLVAPLFANNYSVASVVVPQALTCCTLLLLFKLITLDFPRSLAWLTILALITFPTSYFLIASYSESLFLLLVVLAFYLYRRGQYLGAGLIGALASATRITGAPLLLGAFALNTIHALRTILRQCFILCPRFARRAAQPRGIILRGTLAACRSAERCNAGQGHGQAHQAPCIASLVLIPLGLIAYLLYQWWAFGEPLLFLQGHGSSEWSVGFDPTGPIKALLLPFATPLKHAWTSEAFRANYFNALFFYFALAMLLYGWRRLPLSYSLYALLAVFVPTLIGSLISMPRYVLVSFPMFLSMALLLHTHPRLRLLLLPLALLALAATYLFFKTVFLG